MCLLFAAPGTIKFQRARVTKTTIETQFEKEHPGDQHKMNNSALLRPTLIPKGNPEYFKTIVLDESMVIFERDEALHKL